MQFTNRQAQLHVLLSLSYFLAQSAVQEGSGKFCKISYYRWYELWF